MPKRTGLDEFHRRASEVREIAQGIFDPTERRLVLLFVDDCEKRFAIQRDIAGDRT